MASTNISVKTQTKISTSSKTAVIHAFADIDNRWRSPVPSIFKSDIIQRVDGVPMMDTINDVRGIEGELLLSYEGTTVGELNNGTGELVVEPWDDLAYKYSRTGDDNQDLLYDWDGDGLVGITLALDFAEPGSITFRVQPGTEIFLSPPEDYGFALPKNVTFIEWTFAGQQISQFVADRDIRIEGKTNVIRDNLMRGTKFFTSFNTTAGWDFDIYTNGVNRGAIRPLTDYAEFYVNLPVRPTGRLTFQPYDVLTPAQLARGKMVLSFLLEDRSGMANSLSLSFAVTIGFWTVTKVYANGESIPVSGWLPNNRYTAYLVEIVFERLPGVEPVPGAINNDITLVWNMLNGTSADPASSFAIWLPKLEDVTNFPADQQRASAWIPHVLDTD